MAGHELASLSLLHVDEDHRDIHGQGSVVALLGSSDTLTLVQARSGLVASFRRVLQAQPAGSTSTRPCRKVRSVRTAMRAPFPRLADSGVDVEVDHSDAAGGHANGARLDPRTDSRDGNRADGPAAASQHDAVAPSAVCPSPDASPLSKENERRVRRRSGAGNPFHAHRCDRRTVDESSESARFAGVRGRRAVRHQCHAPRSAMLVP